MEKHLIFDLPDDRHEWEITEAALKIHFVLSELLEHIRTQLKWNVELTVEEYGLLSRMQTRIYDDLTRNDIGGLF